MTAVIAATSSAQADVVLSPLDDSCWSWNSNHPSHSSTTHGQMQDAFVLGYTIASSPRSDSSDYAILRGAVAGFCRTSPASFLLAAISVCLVYMQRGRNEHAVVL